jgi:hypothetical protein
MATPSLKERLEALYQEAIGHFLTDTAILFEQFTARAARADLKG